MISRRFVVALTAVLTVAVGACGSDDDTAGNATPGADEGAAGSELTVVAEDISFPTGTYTADAGSIDVTYENEGSIEHTLVVEDVEGFKLTVTSNGDVDEGTVDLEPGSYTIFCDVPGHREAGMEATLEVS